MMHIQPVCKLRRKLLWCSCVRNGLVLDRW